MTLALVCPGQGSQSVGMGKALAETFDVARRVFEEVDEALGEKLSGVIWDGPMDKLTLTANAQPALMAVSVAAARVLQAQAGLDLATDVSFVAGHSLGEYSALTVAGALTLADAARLLRLRGEAMQRAVPPGIGAMAALLGIELPEALEIAGSAAEGQVCDAANDNGAGQVVLSGHRAAVERAVELAKSRGKRAMMLPVSAPFHCSLMQPAADEMKHALARTTIAKPVPRLIANVTAHAAENPEAIRDNLVRQVTATVRWRESVAAMAASGVTRILEIGAGKVLTGLTKRIAPALSASTCGIPDEVSAFAGIRA